MSRRRSYHRTDVRRRRFLDPFLVGHSSLDTPLSPYVVPVVGLLACILAAILIRSSVESQSLTRMSRPATVVAIRRYRPAPPLSVTVATFDQPPRVRAARPRLWVVTSVLRDSPPVPGATTPFPHFAPATRRPRLSAASLHRARTPSHWLPARAFLVADVVSRIPTLLPTQPTMTPSATRSPTPTVTPSTTPTPPSRAPMHIEQVWVTGYALSGPTSTGVAAGPGICAVDPSYIPLGTRITIDGLGSCVAEDTGPAVIGAHVDVWVPTDYEAYSITGWYTVRW